MSNCKRHGAFDATVVCPVCNKERNYRNRATMKARCISYLGGRCILCGYNRCVAALEFHHTDPTTKDFNISAQLKSWKTMQEELDKCILLCANCHRETEWCSDLLDLSNTPNTSKGTQ